MSPSNRGFEVDGVLLVTGGASGIGRAIAEAFAAEGARGVHLCDMNKDLLEEVAQDLKFYAANPAFEVIYSLMDVTKPEDCEKAVADTVAKWNRLDYAVNCAGITKPRTAIGDYSIADYQAIVDVNLSGVFYGMQAQLKQLEKQGVKKSSSHDGIPGDRGCIVNIGSICGVVGQAELGPYVATKHGVLGLTKTAAEEYGPKNIRVNAVSPGYILTPFIKTERQFAALKKIADDKVPQRRSGYAQEIAAAVLFVASPRASFITGANIPVDGGMSARA
ncbi:3-oxoacyl-reductase [Cystobasidium minutum MCA 4210]|uniref:3-oxoacyl-reductase n=1 Tax=Cystobasidium minutum MCA 4210 TaxID=1397322 RepID=UPI0034CDB834|eukprot:jgi/Rhomi1/213269/estExt_Genemark1.C_100060